MKNKKILIISIVAILVLATLLVVVSPVFAVQDPGEFTAQDFNNDRANDIVGRILGFVQWVGSAAAIIVIVVLGVKYIAGSAEEKADYKKAMVPYIVGAILVFAASNIASWVYSAVSSA